MTGVQSPRIITEAIEAKNMYEHDKKTMASVERIVGGVMDSHRSTGFSSSNADNESAAYYPS